MLQVLLLGLSLVAAAIEKEGNVLVLGDDNWAEALATHNQMLVEFYAPWFVFCRNYTCMKVAQLF